MSGALCLTVIKYHLQYIGTAGTRAICALSDAQHCQVVLTRERGKNGKLMRALLQQGISVLEMPLVETMPGPDRDQLPIALQEGGFDWIVITSPEAAAVFLRGWELAGRPQVPFSVFRSVSINICYTDYSRLQLHTGKPGKLVSMR